MWTIHRIWHTYSMVRTVSWRNIVYDSYEILWSLHAIDKVYSYLRFFLNTCHAAPFPPSIKSDDIIYGRPKLSTQQKRQLAEFLLFTAKKLILQRQNNNKFKSMQTLLCWIHCVKCGPISIGLNLLTRMYPAVKLT